MFAANALVRPHLMLPHFGGDYRGVGVEFLRKLVEDDFGDDLTGRIVRVIVGKGPSFAPFVALLEPWRADGIDVHFGELFVYAGKDDLRVADDGDLRFADLPDFRWIDVDMDDVCVWGEFGKLAGNAVGKARSYAYEQIALGYGHVRVFRAMHAYGAEIERAA